MGEVTRPGVEKLELRPCPCCGGRVDVSECGYSSFNPGAAYCRGDCKREWDLGYVDSTWDCGERWNAKADQIRRQLRALVIIKVDKNAPVLATFYRRDHVIDDAEQLRQFLETTIIGARSPEDNKHKNNT